MPDSAPASFDRQYEALSSGRGIVELTGWSSVTVTGADRQSFLHNFCTNDVKRLTPGASCEAFFTNVKGKIVGHGLVTCRDSELVVIGAPGQAEPLVSHLNRYVIREDVQLRDTTSERLYLIYAGDDEKRGTFWSVVSLPRDNPALYQPLANAAATIDNMPVRWIGWNLLSCWHELIEVSPVDVPRVRQIFLSLGATVCGKAAFDALRIESGTPLFGVDFDDENFPQEIGHNVRALSFTKGCYLGQETVARIDALGHVNRTLVGVTFPAESTLAAGMELRFRETPIGRVASVTYSPRMKSGLALAMIRREFDSPGSQLESPSGPVEVIALPVAGRR